MNTTNILPTTLNLLERFTTISGLKINIDKSELLMLGSCTIWDIPKKYRPIVKESVKILGIHLSRDHRMVYTLNYIPVLDKIKNLATIWSKRNLSLAGKITIIKTMILSKLIYCMTVLPKPPLEHLKDVERITYKFIANNKQEKLPRATLIGDFKEGGYRMTDIHSQLQAINQDG